MVTVRSLNPLQPKDIDISIISAEVLYEDNLLASVLLQSHVKPELFFQKPLDHIFPQHVPMDTNWGKTENCHQYPAVSVLKTVQSIHIKQISKKPLHARIKAYLRKTTNS